MRGLGWLGVGILAGLLAGLLEMGTPARAAGTPRGAAPAFLTAGPAQVFFGVYAAEDGGWQLWRTQGTQNTTEMLVSGLGLDLEMLWVNTELFFGTREGLWRSDGTTRFTRRIKDLPFAPTGMKRVYFETGDHVLFSDGKGQLWTSDGTTEGTVLVKDIPPARAFHDLTPAAITAWGTQAFFRALGPPYGVEPWVTDGTPEGTRLLRDINPGGGSFPKNFTTFNRKILFAADSGTGFELWSTNGSGDGAFLVADINPTGGSDPSNFHVYGPQVLFSADDGDGPELWSTNGAPGGAIKVADLNPYGGSYPSSFRRQGGPVFFRADDGTHGSELWTIRSLHDAPELVKDIAPHGGSSLRNLRMVNGRLFFTADDGTHGEELWYSDGTAATTRLVRDLNPNGSAAPKYLRPLGQLLLFSADDGEHGESLWVFGPCGKDVAPPDCPLVRLDVTPPAATRHPRPFLVRDIFPGPGDGEPESLTASGHRLFFLAKDAETGRELWTSDGTESGTHLVKDLRPGPESANIEELTDVAGTLFFRFQEPGHASALWKSDGTAAGTTVVGGVASESAYPGRLTPVGSSLYFSWLGQAIYRTDGVSVAAVADPTVIGTPFALHAIADTLYVVTQGAGGQGQIWRLAPSDTAPVQVADGLLLGAYDGPSRLTAAAGTIFFRGGTEATGVELYRTDGAPGTTRMVRDIMPGRRYSAVDELVAGNGVVFFTAFTDATGREVWRSDGTEQGTSLVQDVLPGAASSEPRRLRVVDGVLYFLANDGRNGFELWRSDGTDTGTRLVRDIDPTDVTVPSFLTGVGPLLFFSAHTPSFGYELWRSDGTAAGTDLVANVNLTASSYPESLAVVDGTLFFYADDGVHGDELWALPACGNGTLDPGEQCDDGNLNDGDSCPSSCRLDEAAGPCVGGTRCVRGSQLRVRGRDDLDIQLVTRARLGGGRVGEVLDPTQGGAVLELLNPTTEEIVRFPLPAQEWNRIDGPRGPTFRFDGGEAARRVILRLGQRGLRARLHADDSELTLDEPHQGTLVARLTVPSGERYCLQFGGRSVYRDRGAHGAADGVFAARGARPPRLCR